MQRVEERGSLPGIAGRFDFTSSGQATLQRNLTNIEEKMPERGGSSLIFESRSFGPTESLRMLPHIFLSGLIKRNC